MTGFTKQNSFLLGVAGGSGSGKTYFAEALQKALGPENCQIISQDNYYFDQSRKFDYDGGSVNFDHPESIDFDLLTKQMIELKSGQEVQIPTYDFATHSRRPGTILVRPKPLVIVDGILIFHPKKLCDIFDDRIFFDTPEQVRFSRRLERDVKERGRSPEGVKNQFLNQVKPMHDQFVEPSKCFAQSVVKELEEFDSALAGFLEKLKHLK